MYNNVVSVVLRNVTSENDRNTTTIPSRYIISHRPAHTPARMHIILSDGEFFVGDKHRFVFVYVQ